MKNIIYKRIIKNIFSISIVFVLLMSPLRTNAAINTGKIVGSFAVGYGICYGSAKAKGYIDAGIDWIANTVGLGGILGTDNVPVDTKENETTNNAKTIKECGFDFAANQLKQELIKGIVSSTTEWVKGGYKGKPSFITNPDQFLNEATDQFIGDFIEHTDSTKFLCKPFEIPLKFAIDLQFYTKSGVDTPRCTLSDIEDNIDGALGDLTNFYNADGHLNSGDFWSTFIQSNTVSGNNSYETFLQVSDDLKSRIGEQNRKKLNDINMNGGFMSIEKCDPVDADTYVEGASNRICSKELESCKKNIGEDLSLLEKCESSFNRCLERNGGKENCRYVTPGSIISEEVAGVVKMERESLQLADEFDELIAAIITNLISKVFDSNTGLSGVNSSGDGSDYESSVDIDITAEKSSMVKRYDPRAYDIQLRIYQSILDAIEPQEGLDTTMSKLNNESKYWENRDTGDLETKDRLKSYWKIGGYDVAQSKNWSGAFISFITNGDVKFSYKDNTIFNVSTSKYVVGEAQIFPGSIICNLKDRVKEDLKDKNNYCDFVESVGSGNAYVVGVRLNDDGKYTLKRDTIKLGGDKGLFDRENMMVITAPEGSTSDKYNTEYYKELFGGDYEGPTGEGFSSENGLEEIKGALEAWKRLKEDYNSVGGELYTVRSGNYITKLTNEFIDKAISEFGDIDSMLTVGERELKVIKKLRDKTIVDREAAYDLVKKINKAVTMSELLELSGNVDSPNLSKAYNIYNDVKGKLSGNVNGIEAEAEDGGMGYRAGIGTYTWIMTSWSMDGHLRRLPELVYQFGPKESWMTREGYKEWEETKNNPYTITLIENGKTPAIITDPWSIEELENEFVAPKDYVDGLNLVPYQIGYDPIDDIKDLQYNDASEYDYNSI